MSSLLISPPKSTRFSISLSILNFSSFNSLTLTKLVLRIRSPLSESIWSAISKAPPSFKIFAISSSSSASYSCLSFVSLGTNMSKSASMQCNMFIRAYSRWFMSCVTLASRRLTEMLLDVESSTALRSARISLVSLDAAERSSNFDSINVSLLSTSSKMVWSGSSKAFMTIGNTSPSNNYSCASICSIIESSSSVHSI